MEFLILIFIFLFPTIVLSCIIIPSSTLLFIILMRITTLTPWRVPSKNGETLNLPKNENFHNSFKTTTKCFKIATTILLFMPSLFCFTNIISDFDNFIFYFILLILPCLITFVFSMIFLFFYKHLFVATNYAKALLVLVSPFIPSFLSFSLGILFSIHYKINQYLWIAIIIYAIAITIMSIILLFLRKLFKKECDSPEQQSE